VALAFSHSCCPCIFAYSAALAPTSLAQPIQHNWAFLLFRVNLGTASNVRMEQRAMEQVDSYGEQIGHLAEALRILGSSDLSRAERDVIQVTLGSVAAVHTIKSKLQ
jgi:hypothetical protein